MSSQVISDLLLGRRLLSKTKAKDLSLKIQIPFETSALSAGARARMKREWNLSQWNTQVIEMCSVNPNKQNIWPLAQSWVSANRVLIWYIAAPYHRYMSCDSSDLAGEAKLAVYQVISALIDQNKDLSLTSKYFRTVFRTRCIQMAAGVALVNEHQATVAIQNVQSPDRNESSDIDDSVIAEALSALTGRQRQVSQWILSQPKPVSFYTIANHFGIHIQSVRRILSNTIRRIEGYENKRIC